MSKDKTSVLVRMPKDLKQRLQKQAKEQGVSLNQMIVYSLSHDVTQLEGQRYLERRIEGKSQESIEQKFWAVMDKVQDRSELKYVCIDGVSYFDFGCLTR